MEVLVAEANWSERMFAAKGTPIQSLNGNQSPSVDISVIAAYSEQYPWMSFKVFEDAGQMLIFQKTDLIIPRLAEAAHNAANARYTLIISSYFFHSFAQIYLDWRA